jgi:hypothetical protein
MVKEWDIEAMTKAGWTLKGSMSSKMYDRMH